MIRELALRNWRNYEDVALTFGQGTTFVVASNGIGKTSLIEAARWALFGQRTAGDHTAVRKGASSATARVQFELPDHRLLSIERTLQAKPRASSIPAQLTIDGTQYDPDLLDEYLADAYGARSTFLARLTMPSADRADPGPSAMGFEEHLGHYYGVEALRNAVVELAASRKDNDARIRRVKQTNSAATQRLDQLVVEADQAGRRVAEIAESHRVLLQRQANRRSWETFQQQQRDVQQANERAAYARDELTRKVLADLDVSDRSARLADVIEERRILLDRDLDRIRAARASNEARRENLATNRARLEEAHDDCPVCRRPLDGETVAVAAEAHAEELRTLERSDGELATEEADVRAQQDRLRAVLAEWHAIPAERSPLPAPLSGDETISSYELDALVERTMADLVEARAQELQTERDRDEAVAAAEAMRELETLFRREAALKIAIDTTDATLRELLNETIRPLAAEVNQRWRALFPDRGDLTTHSDGRVTRSVNGYPLSSESFSTGESTGLTIVFRLLVAQMATSADFCWFDEPLEHLAPEVRRQVARTLAGVTRGGGPLRQVVVTTYEEPLARRIKAQDVENVNLIDVRAM